MINNKEKQKILIKNNILIEAKYNLNLVENRIFTLLLYKFQKEKGKVLTCTLSYEEFKNVIKNKNENTINGIINILKSLQRKQIIIKERKENSKNTIWYSYNLINGFYFDDEHSIFIIEATARIYKLLQKYFVNGYTAINISILLGLNNYYAQRLYEILRLWSGTKSILNYTIDELKELLQIKDLYSLYGDFKRRVIVPAIKELNKTGFFQIDFKEIKKGRKVISIDFLVKDLDTRIYFKEFEEIELSHNISDNTIENNEKLQLTKKIGIENILHIENKAVIKIINNKFKNYDFQFNKETIWECEIITLEKDNNMYDSINANNYKYFIDILTNKIQLKKNNNNSFNDFS
ncbi:replication initiation protein [Clostridium botulinum C]|uniref:replication initiation protein n=1 Tax=Clostridium botulinum TaxID=1491 RepID=UPI001E5913B3|nr:replication initiation protein [Clostridium botulinum]MCD3217266.1 replication initiation protein [Clostridium botulinum C]MCD3246008.1 replication initiation protein [Clostridium botulinum C]MCD3262506.1 replication initiation protein [Clostridium botulinum C]